MTSLIGRQLGRYEIRAELGRGGMARVYRAVDTLLQRQVAIKILAAQLSLDDEFVRRFQREATTAANLRHPAIVTIYDVGEQDGLYYIAMEYVDGRSLHHVLEERATLGLGYAISLLDPVARALDYAHEQGAVHRDIKPHNILVDRDGRIVLTDFGIAQTPDSDGERLTRTGIFMGTPEYISPEQAEARRVDGRSDLYSLGVVAYEIITGRVPFAGPTPQLIVAHSQLPPPPPTSVRAHLPSELDELMARALAKRPAQRYPTGVALVDALRDVAARYGVPAASREQLAALADAAGSSPAPRLPEPIPSPPRQRSPVAPAARPPATGNSAGQPTTRDRTPVQPPAPPPRPPAQRPPTVGANGGARPATIPPRLSRGDTASPAPLPLFIIGGLLVAVTVALLLWVAQGLANSGSTRPTATPPPSPSLALPTQAPPTQPGLVTTMVTATPTPTSEPAPTAEPTAAPEPTLAPPTPPPAQPTLAPQPTPAPPVATLIPEPSATPEPPTSTPEPPTSTPEPPTSTPEPPTSTATATTSPTPEPTPILNNTPIVLTPSIQVDGL